MGMFSSFLFFCEYAFQEQGIEFEKSENSGDTAYDRK